MRTAPSRAAGLYVGRAGSNRRRRLQQQPPELRGGNGGQAPPRPGRDGSPRAGRRAGEGLAEGSPQAGRAGQAAHGREERERARSPQLGRRGADATRLVVNHRPEGVSPAVAIHSTPAAAGSRRGLKKCKYIHVGECI